MENFYHYVRAIPGEKESYRERKIIVHGNSFSATTSRVGQDGLTEEFPLSFLSAYIDECKEQGYVDRSVYVSSESSFKREKDTEVNSLITYLLNVSRKHISNHFSVSWDSITPEMVYDVQLILDNIDCDNVDSVNNGILEIRKIVPRKVKNLNEGLAADIADVPALIQQERDDLAVLSAQSKMNTTTDNRKSFLESQNVTVRPCTEQETEYILSKLDFRTRKHFSKAFAVRNEMTHKRFTNWCKEHNAKESDIYHLFHGSRAANQIGIMTEGLRLNSGAQVTGSMFGNFPYFSTYAYKSYGYVGMGDSVWTRGHASKGYMWIFDVAATNPKHIDTWHHYMSSWNAEKIKPYDAVFVHPMKPGCSNGVLHPEECPATVAQTDCKFLIELK